MSDMMERECGPLDPVFVRIITAELVNALLHLKKHGVIHRDIKPENVLIDAAGNAVLTDFGYTKTFAEATFVSIDGEVRFDIHFPGDRF